MKSSVHLRYAIIGLGGTAVLFLLLTFTTSWWWYLNWLVSASVLTFLLYGLDKTQAKREKGRVPNLILHMMALIGGYLGALVGRSLFNHKSNFRRNPEFLIIIILGLLISIAFIAWHLYQP